MPKNTLKGIVVALLGLVFTNEILLTMGNGQFFSPVLALYTSLGLGVYFLGLNIMVNTLIKQNDNAALIDEIQQIKNKLDSGIIFSQNTIAVVNDEKPKKRDMALVLWGVLAGLWGGILGGLLTNDLSDITSLVNSSKPIPLAEAEHCIILFLILGGLSLYIVKIIDELMASKSSKTT